MMPTVPYDRIAAQPDTFYDTSTFVFPVALKMPSQLDRASVAQLGEYCNAEFGSQAPDDARFYFRSKEDITERLSKADKEAETPQDADADKMRLRQVDFS